MPLCVSPRVTLCVPYISLSVPVHAPPVWPPCLPCVASMSSTLVWYCVSPTITPRASGLQWGARSPEKAGTKYSPSVPVRGGIHLAQALSPAASGTIQLGQAWATPNGLRGITNLGQVSGSNWQGAPSIEAESSPISEGWSISPRLQHRSAARASEGWSRGTGHAGHACKATQQRRVPTWARA